MEIKKDLQDFIESLHDLASKAESLMAAIEESEKKEANAEKITKPVIPQKTPVKPVKKTEKTERKKVIRTIKAMRKKGSSFEDIARHLESKGIPTFSGKGQWRKQTVHKLYQKHS